MEVGFLNKPTAMAYDSELQLLAIGNKAGDIRMYSFCCTAWSCYYVTWSSLGGRIKCCAIAAVNLVNQ